MNENFLTTVLVNSSSLLLPDKKSICNWVHSTIQDKLKTAELCILIVDKAEGKQLNSKWRHKDYATNILSFPADIPQVVNSPFIGDLVACAPIIEEEAEVQGKNLTAHWAHMIIHGTLHLLGYDHISEEETKTMEDLEIKILSGLGYKNPYLI